MESRFSKLIPTRRVKARASELDLHSVPYQATASPTHLPVFLHQPLRKSRAEARRDDEALAIQSVAYTHTVAGKPPIMGGRPQKGNGPVKLQTSRRLSSGELLVTSQDYQRTIEDIREGDYVVAGKPGRTSRLSQVRSQSSLATYAAPPVKFVSTAPNSPRGMSGVINPSFATLPRPNEHMDSPVSISGVLSASNLPSTSPQMPPVLNTDTQFSGHPIIDRPDGLGIITQSPTSMNDPSLVTSSLLEPQEEQNATIQALWKAEYTRLVAIYGQAGVDRNIAELNKDQKLAYRDSTTAANGEPVPSIMLEALLPPVFDARSNLLTKRSSGGSHGDTSHRDDYSDGSSQKRLSLLSSTGAASSYTTRTSVGDSDQSTTREDLRRIVEEMRSTYLRAIETQSTPIKKPTKKKKKSQPSPTLPESSPVSVQQLLADQQSWRSSSSSISPPNNTRRSITPVPNSTQRLPSIEGSPLKKGEEVEVGLKRADSTTLGAYIASTKRSTLSKRKSSKTRSGSKRSSRRASSMKTTLPIQIPTDLADNSQHGASFSSTASEVKDFEDLCRDLFGTSTENPVLTNTTFFRSSSSSSSSSPSLTSTKIDKPLPPPPQIDHRTSFLDLSEPVAPPPTTSLPPVPSSRVITPGLVR